MEVLRSFAPTTYFFVFLDQVLIKSTVLLQKLFGFLNKFIELPLRFSVMLPLNSGLSMKSKNIPQRQMFPHPRNRIQCFLFSAVLFIYFGPASIKPQSF